VGGQPVGQPPFGGAQDVPAGADQGRPFEFPPARLLQLGQRMPNRLRAAGISPQVHHALPVLRVAIAELEIRAAPLAELG
jgi:hypothetical protein